MNSASFQDSIFLVNTRIRMVRDTFRLSPPAELFLEKCLEDLVFIDKILAVLAQTLVTGDDQYGGNGEFSHASDAEWQLSQLLTEFSVETGPFSCSANPDIREKITALREASDARRKSIEEAEQSSGLASADPVVSSAELNSLLGGN